MYDSKDKGAAFRYDYLLAQYSLARHLSAAGDASAARQAYSRCLDLARQAVRARPSLSEGILVGSLLKDMAVGSMAVPAEDVTAYRDYVESLASDADAGSDTLRTRGREVRSPREVLIQHYETLAAILRMRSDGAPAAYEQLKKTLALYEQALRSDQQDTGSRHEFGRSLMFAWSLSMQLRNQTGAITHLRRAIEVLDDLIRAGQNNLDVRASLSLAHFFLARTLYSQGNIEEAFVNYVRFSEVLQQTPRPEFQAHVNLGFDLTDDYVALARRYEDKGRDGKLALEDRVSSWQAAIRAYKAAIAVVKTDWVKSTKLDGLETMRKNAEEELRRLNGAAETVRQAGPSAPP